MLASRGVLACCAIGLVACAPEPRLSRVVLELPVALGCRPTDVDGVEITALGDFPASGANVVSFDPAAPIDRVDRFPDDTRLLAIEAVGAIGSESWIGGGVVEVSDVEGSDGTPLRVPLSSYGRACPLADDRARIPEGAAVVALPDGRVWIAGGHEAGAVLSGVLTVRPTDTLATPSAVRLFVERTGATASLIDGDLIVLAGGSGAVDGDGEDTAEIVRVSTDQRVGDAFLLRARRDHAAIAIDRRVILSGGREARDGAPIGSVEVVTIEDERGESASFGELAVPRAGHVMLALDDGTIAIAGGTDAGGAPVAIVERLDPSARTIEVMGELRTARAGAAYVALPGGRVAQIGGREEDAWTGHVELVLERGEAVHLEDAIPALERPVAAAVRGGAVLVSGRDLDGRRASVVLDPDASGPPRAVQAARAGATLVALADGSFLEGEPSGISILRVGLATALDAPPASIAPAFMEDREEHLALDAPARWRARAGALEAVEAGARFDVPTLRFAEVAITLVASGAIELLLVADDRPPVVIALGQDGVTTAGCRAELDEGAPLRVVRAGARVTLDGGRGAVDCALELPERIGVAIRAAREGAAVRRLELERL